MKALFRWLFAPRHSLADLLFFAATCGAFVGGSIGMAAYFALILGWAVLVSVFSTNT